MQDGMCQTLLFLRCQVQISTRIRADAPLLRDFSFGRKLRCWSQSDRAE